MFSNYSQPITTETTVSPKAIYSFLYLMRSLNLSDFVDHFCKGIYVLVQKLKRLIPLGPGQSVYLVWKASEEAHLVKPLVHAHRVLSVAH